MNPVGEDGKELTDREIINHLASSVLVMFRALATSTELMRLMVQQHVDKDHGGDWKASCGILDQLRENEMLIQYGPHSSAPAGTTCH